MSDAPANDRRMVFIVPPGACAVLSSDGSGGSSIPVWFYWLRVAHLQAEIAQSARPSDEMIDWSSAQLAGIERERPSTADPSEWSETFAALVAVSAATHALDGLYGTVTPLIVTHFTHASRRRRILETLKLGFRVGKVAQQRWIGEFDWLYRLRDDAIHHAEAIRPLVEYRVTDESVVWGAPESLAYQAESARRAADLVVDVVRECLTNPKPGTAEWAAQWRQSNGVMGALGLEPDPPPPDRR